LRREHPSLTEREVDARSRAWLHEGLGAPFGDAVGRQVPGLAAGNGIRGLPLGNA
jgi:Rv0078B-related antitoxin